MVVPRDEITKIYDKIDTAVHEKTHQKVTWIITVHGTTPGAVMMRHCPVLNSTGLMGKMLEFVLTHFFIVITAINFLFYWVAYFYSVGPHLLALVAMQSPSLLC